MGFKSDRQRKYVMAKLNDNRPRNWNLEENVVVNMATPFLLSTPQGQMIFSSICLKEWVNFIDDVNKYGLETALENKAIDIATNSIISSISSYLWVNILNNAHRDMRLNLNKDSILKIAEQTFKKTTNELLGGPKITTLKDIEKSIKKCAKNYSEKDFLELYRQNFKMIKNHLQFLFIP